MRLNYNIKVKSGKPLFDLVLNLGKTLEKNRNFSLPYAETS